MEAGDNSRNSTGGRREGKEEKVEKAEDVDPSVISGGWYDPACPYRVAKKNIPSPVVSIQEFLTFSVR